MSTAELPIAKTSKAPAIPKAKLDWIPLALAPIMALARCLSSVPSPPG